MKLQLVAGKTTLVKLMCGELQPTLGDIRPHGHLKLGRFTQHFVDVLDLELTPLEFFEREYPGMPREELRKYLGRFGVSGKMQVSLCFYSCNENFWLHKMIEIDVGGL